MRHITYFFGSIKPQITLICYVAAYFVIRSLVAYI